jgi:hypothetical protein
LAASIGATVDLATNINVIINGIITTGSACEKVVLQMVGPDCVYDIQCKALASVYGRQPQWAKVELQQLVEIMRADLLLLQNDPRGIIAATLLTPSLLAP